MHITYLTLHNFRNIETAELHPSKRFNVLWGHNAQGKTNTLEAIYVLANLKTFRGAKNNDLISWNRDIATIASQFRTDATTHSIHMGVTSKFKRIRFDGKEVQSVKNLSRSLKTILFTPEEMTLIKGNPAGRRALLDRAVFQFDPTSLHWYQTYARVLKQRNHLLKQGRPQDEVTPWTEELIQTGARIRHIRHLYLSEILPHLTETYRNISQGHEVAELNYREGDDVLESLQAALADQLGRTAEQEKRLGQTLAGPHRDDPVFLVDNRSLRTYGSQGQQRSFLLAFKTAQILHMKEKKGITPILLLDDMTSELDRRRQEYFFSFLHENQGQVFITTTDKNQLIRDGFTQARFYNVSQGGLQEAME